VTMTPRQKMARTLQKLVEDETGTRPKLGTCFNVVDTYPPDGWPGARAQERAANMFLAYRDLLTKGATR
jgi:hypothetical protein